jgi:hypothetical protein
MHEEEEAGRGGSTHPDEGAFGSFRPPDEPNDP